MGELSSPIAMECTSQLCASGSAASAASAKFDVTATVCDLSVARWVGPGAGADLFSHRIDIQIPGDLWSCCEKFWQVLHSANIILAHELRNVYHGWD